MRRSAGSPERSDDQAGTAKSGVEGSVRVEARDDYSLFHLCRAHHDLVAGLNGRGVKTSPVTGAASCTMPPVPELVSTEPLLL